MLFMQRDILSEIAASTAQAVGKDFLAALVRSMREAMDASLVLITVGVGSPPTRARSIACFQTRPVNEVTEYDLEGVPCRLVYEGQTVVIPKRLYEQFPKEGSYEGYIGVPLWGGSGRPLGHLAVLSEQPLTDPEQATAIVRLFALRAEAELQRSQQEGERESLIASLRRANQRIGRRHSELRKVNEMKTMLLGMVAHDLRNPLATIVNRSEFIGNLLDRIEQDSPHIGKARESSDIIIAAAERMDRLIASTLAQAQAQTNVVNLDRHSCALHRVVDVAVQLNAEAAQRKDIALNNTVPANITASVDEDRLAECLDNLIQNAIKYSPSGGKISITASASAKGLTICVKDTGQGMSEEDLERAFRLFQRLSAQPAEGETSTGLGLAIVKAIVEAHGGAVKALSEGKGKGTMFEISLPHGN